MDEHITIRRDLLQDLIDDVSDYAESRQFKKVEWQWRTQLLESARAALAPAQPIYQRSAGKDWRDIGQEEYAKMSAQPDKWLTRIVYAASTPTKDQT